MKNDTQITTWIPKELKAALDEGCINVSKALRQGLFHLLGEGIIQLPDWNGEHLERKLNRRSTFD